MQQPICNMGAYVILSKNGLYILEESRKQFDTALASLFLNNKNKVIEIMNKYTD